MAEGQGKDDGSLVELIDMLNENMADRSIPVEDIDDFISRHVPDPNQLSIPSEPFDRRDFSQKLPKASPFSMGQFTANSETLSMGADIVLGSILEQLNLPSTAHATTMGTFTSRELDIADFFDSFDPPVQSEDLMMGRNRDVFGLGI